MYDWSFSVSTARATNRRAVAFHDPRVVPGPERLRSGAAGERKELVEAERSVAPRARVRGVSGDVARDEGVHDGLPELLPQVQGDMREAERMTRRARGRDRLRRAARTLGRRAGRVLPEPKGYADRIRSRAEQRDRAVDAPAHRDHDAAGLRARPERPVPVRQRAPRPRAARRSPQPPPAVSARRASGRGRARLQQRCALRRRPAHGGPLAVPRRIADDLHPCHVIRLDADRRTPPASKVLHPAGDASVFANLALPGGCRAGRRQRLSPTPAPFT